MISRDKVRQLLKDLAAYAIDVPAKYQQFQEQKDADLETYIKELKSKKDSVIESDVNQMGSQVDKASFVRVLANDWTSSYRIRQHIAHH